MHLVFSASLHSLFNASSETESSVTEIADFEIVVDNLDPLDGKIIVDKNTGVLYYLSIKDELSPIYNSDGTLKLYKGKGESDE